MPGLRCSPNEKAGEFDPTCPWVSKAIERVQNPLQMGLRRKFCCVEAHIDTLVAEWRNEVDRHPVREEKVAQFLIATGGRVPSVVNGIR